MAMTKQEATVLILRQAVDQWDEGVSGMIARLGADIGGLTPEESGQATGRAMRLVGDAMGIRPPGSSAEAFGRYWESVSDWADHHNSEEVTAVLKAAEERAKQEAAK